MQPVDQLIEAAKAPVLGRMVESSLGYGYDPAGNRNQILENGVAQEFTVNGKNELTGTAATQSAPVRFAGTVSAASTVTLAGQPATMSANGLSWEKTLTLGAGAQRNKGHKDNGVQVCTYKVANRWRRAAMSGSW